MSHDTDDQPFDQTTAEILAVTKALTDPATLADAFADYIADGSGCDLLAIIFGASSDAAKLKAINKLKAVYLDAPYTQVVINAEISQLVS
jgi:hypothetical protein